HSRVARVMVTVIARLVLIPHRPRQLPQRVVFTRRHTGQAETLIRTTIDRLAAPVLQPPVRAPRLSLRFADLIYRAVIPRLLHRWHPLIIRPPHPILHGFGEAVGFRPDDLGAEDEAELVSGGEGVPPGKPEQGLLRNPV